MEQHAKTKLGFVSLACLVIGNMIGAAVYVNSFYSIQALGDAKLVLLVWLIGGVHAFCGALAYAAVASRLPISGGEYTFLSRCVHPGVGFVAGWISMVAGFTAPIAVAALLLGKYTLPFVAELGFSPELIQRSIATVAIVISAILYGYDLKAGAHFNNLVIAIKLLCFAFFLAIGLPFILSQPYDGLYALPNQPVDSKNVFERLGEPSTQMAMVVQLFYVSLAYTGFNASIYLVGDLERDGNRSKHFVSRSMWVSCLAVMCIYLMLNAVFLYGLPSSELVAAGEGFVPVVAKNIAGEWLATMMRLAIVLSAMTSVLAMLATGPMVYAQMARDGFLPRFVDSNGRDTRIPTLIQAVLSCLVVWISSIEAIISYLGLTLTACGALAVSSIWFAKRGFVEPKPIRLYEHLATAIYVTGALVLLFAASQTELQRSRFYMCVGTFLTGALVYAFVYLKNLRGSQAS